MAGNRIRGITVEIGGDTTKLDKALAGTNKQITSTQKALKDVERLLKLDPGNAELLAQKQRLLAQETQATAQKLETLRQVAQNADAALQRGRDYQAKYEPLKAELDQVSATMKGLEANEASMREQLATGQISTQQYDAFVQKLEETRERHKELQQAVRDLDREFSGARMDQSQYDALQRELIETEQELHALEDQARESTSRLARLGDAAQEVSNKAGKVRDAFAPLSTAILGVGAAAAATVPATEEFRADLSLLDNNARRSGISVDSVRQAFKEFNTVSGEADSSIEAISNLLQAGFTESNLQIAVEGLANAAVSFPDTLKIESLADSIQETLATGSATGQFGELLDRLGYGAETFSQNLAYCTTELDKQSLVLSVLVNGPLKGAYEGWVQNNEGLVASRDASLDLQVALGELAEKIQPLITELVSLATEFLNWFNSLDEGTQKAIIGIGATAAAISPLAGIVASVSGALPGLVGLLGKLGNNGLAAALAFGTLVALAIQVAAVWDDMSGLEKVVVIFGAVSAAALAAAVAVGAFQSAATLGMAAVGIVAGIAAIMAAINSASQRANRASQDIKRAGMSGRSNIPGFAEGGVVPPNQPFLAVLGDNKREPEVVSPYSTIKQAARDALSEGGGMRDRPVNLYLDGTKLGRALLPYIDEETTRKGVQLIGGRR